MAKVLVTGGSGFLGSYCILHLLAAGHEVKATVRNVDKVEDVRAALTIAGASKRAPLDFVVADLTADDGWSDAVSNCEHVLHVASPFPASQPSDANELIVPARDGTLRVLRAARDGGVKRVVMTSSFAAVGYGREHPGRPYTEDDWTEEDAPNAPYIRSKTIAERAAWEFINAGNLELSVINPVGIFGPALGPDFSTSIGIIKALIEGKVPGPPKMNFGVVDVRDVANLHISAMTSPDANGQRFIAASGPAITLVEVAHVLREDFGSAARIAAELVDFDTTSLQDMNSIKNASSAKAQRLLGWRPRSNHDAIVASAESLFRLNLIDARK